MVQHPSIRPSGRMGSGHLSDENGYFGVHIDVDARPRSVEIPTPSYVVGTGLSYRHLLSRCLTCRLHVPKSCEIPGCRTSHNYDHHDISRGGSAWHENPAIIFTIGSFTRLVLPPFFISGQDASSGILRDHDHWPQGLQTKTRLDVTNENATGKSERCPL